MRDGEPTGCTNRQDVGYERRGVQEGSWLEAAVLSGDGQVVQRAALQSAFIS